MVRFRIVAGRAKRKRAMVAGRSVAALAALAGFAAAATTPAPVARAADVSALWNGGTGFWGDASQWTPAVVPDNAAQTFDVTLNAGVATLSSNVTIQKLTLGGTARLSSPFGMPFQITANDTFTWDTAARITTNTSIVANGGVAASGGAGDPLGHTDQLTLTVPAGKTFTSSGGNLAMRRSRIFNSGTMTFAAQGAILPPSSSDFDTNTVNNAAGATINVNAFTNFHNTALNNAGGTVNVAATLWLGGGGTWTGGTLAGTGGVNLTRFTHTFDAASSIAPTISIDVTGGQAFFNMPMTRAAGTNVGDGQTAVVADFKAAVTFNPGAGLTVKAQGDARFTPGTIVSGPVAITGGKVSNLTINAPWTVSPGPSQFSSVSTVIGVTSNAALTQTGSLDIGGTFTNNSTIAGAVNAAYNGNGTLLNNGALGGTTLTFGPSLTVTNTPAGGSINVSGVTTVGGTLHNYGTFTVTTTGGAGGGSLALNGLTDNHTAITAPTFVSVAGVLAQYTGASVTITGSGRSLYNSGTLRAYAAGAGDADDPATAGVFTLNSNLQMLASPFLTPSLEVEVGGTTPGTEHDLFDVNGTAILDGVLTLRFLNNFENAVLPGQTFTILTADAPITGGFDNLFNGNRVATADGLGSFAVTTAGNNLVLSDFNTTVPEPASATAVAAALLALSTNRASRRRRI